MKNNNLSLYIILFASISIGIFSFNPIFAEIDTDKSVYSKGELVNISGSLDLQDDQKINIVEIEIINFDNDFVVNEYMPIDDDNNFSKSYESATWTAGDYVLKFSYNDVEESTEFEISDSSLSDDEGNSSSDTNESNTAQQESTLTSSNTIQVPPTDLNANVVSSTQIDLTWSTSNDNSVSITGYKIEARTNTDPNYSIVVENTGNIDTAYSHMGLIPDTVYTYRVSAINSAGESEPSGSTTVKTSSSISVSNTSIGDTDVPIDVVAKVISSTSVELSWSPPTQTYGQTIQDYVIKQEFASGVYGEIANTVSTNTKYVISNLSTDKTYTFVVIANYLHGSSDISEKSTVTLTSSSNSNSNNDESKDDDKNNNTQQENESSLIQDDDGADDSNISSSPTITPSQPVDLQAIVISQNRINLSWSAPIDNGASSLLGYKIESKTSNESDYAVLITNTGIASTTTYSHTGLTAGLTYNYRIYAINSSGEGSSSDMVEVTIVMPDQQNESREQSSLTLQPLQITLSTDKSVYGPDDSIKISGTTNDSTQNMPLGMRVISSDGTIVYARSISIDNDNLFEIVITPVQRQSSVWSSNAEFTVEVAYNGRVHATSTFENNGDGSLPILEKSDESMFKSNSSKQSRSSLLLNESVTSNGEINATKNQNNELQSINQQLQNENNQLKTQIEELNKKIEQLNAVILEQVRVMMETINPLKSDD